MFEKEAERSFDELDDRGVGDDWSIEESYVNGFSIGAEFGYNKANEEFGYNKAFVETENRNCSNCRRSKTGCPNDGSCHNFSLWRPFKNSELTKAKELIGEFISSLSVVGECGEEECELLNRAEQFLKESE